MRAKHYRHKARCNRSRNNAAQCKSTPRASSSHTIQGYRRTQTPPCQPYVEPSFGKIRNSDTSYSIFRTWYPNYRVPFCIRMQRFWSQKSAFSGFNLATIELQQKNARMFRSNQPQLLYRPTRRIILAQQQTLTG